MSAPIGGRGRRIRTTVPGVKVPCLNRLAIPLCRRAKGATSARLTVFPVRHKSFLVVRERKFISGETHKPRWWQRTDSNRHCLSLAVELRCHNADRGIDRPRRCLPHLRALLVFPSRQVKQNRRLTGAPLTGWSR